jgi:hypothetical protein
MRAINHTVTGAIIGAVVGTPELALPLAFFSHFVLDVLPHYGGEDLKSTQFKIELLVDASLSLAFLLAIFLLRIEQWPLIIGCGILAASPDLLWFPYWVLQLIGKPRPFDPVSRFLAWIQWCERPWGIYVETVWLIATLYIFFRVTV